MALPARPSSALYRATFPSRKRNSPLSRVPNHKPPSASSCIAQIFICARALVAASVTKTPPCMWLRPRSVPIHKSPPAVFKHGARTEVCQPVPHLITDDAEVRPFGQNVIQPLVGGHPHAPVPVLGHGADKVVGQPVSGGQMRRSPCRNAEHPVSIGSGP